MPREDRRLLFSASPLSDIEFPVPTGQDFGGGGFEILPCGKIRVSLRILNPPAYNYDLHVL